MVQELNTDINPEYGNNYEDSNMPKLTQQLKQQLKENLEGIPPIRNIKELEELKEIYKIDTHRNKIRNDQEYEFCDCSNLGNNTNGLFYTFIEKSLQIGYFNNGKLEEGAIYYGNNINGANDGGIMYAIGNFKDGVLSEGIYLYKDYKKAERVHSNGDKEIRHIDGDGEIQHTDGNREILHNNGDRTYYNDKGDLSKIQFNQ